MRKLLSAIVAATIFLSGLALAGDHRTYNETFLAAGKRSASSQSTGFNVSEYSEAQILIDVTAETGTTTLDITIETSADDSTYFTHTAMTQITATGRYRQAITNFGKYVRISYAISGTDFTFSAVGVFKN